MLLVSVTCLPVTLVVVSFSRQLKLLSAMMAVMGLAMGVIDCVANLQLILIYDKAVAPFLQVYEWWAGQSILPQFYI